MEEHTVELVAVLMFALAECQRSISTQNAADPALTSARLAMEKAKRCGFELTQR
jgi:hypothetical protein